MNEGIVVVGLAHSFNNDKLIAPAVRVLLQWFACHYAWCICLMSGFVQVKAITTIIT
jgi:hypothetical protein